MTPRPSNNDNSADLLAQIQQLKFELEAERQARATEKNKLLKQQAQLEQDYVVLHNSLQTKLGMERGQHDLIKIEASQKQALINQLNQDNWYLRQVYETLKKTISDLSAQLNLKEVNISSLNSNITQINNNLLIVREENAVFLKLLAQAKECITVENEQKRAAHSAIQNLSQQNSELIEALKQEQEKANTMQNTYSKQITEINESIQKLQGLNDALQTMIETYKKQLEEAQVYIQLQSFKYSKLEENKNIFVQTIKECATALAETNRSMDVLTGQNEYLRVLNEYLAKEVLQARSISPVGISSMAQFVQSEDGLAAANVNIQFMEKLTEPQLPALPSAPKMLKYSTFPTILLNKLNNSSELESKTPPPTVASHCLELSK